MGNLWGVSRQNSTLQGPKSTLSTLSSSLREGIESLLGVDKVRHNDAAVKRIRGAMLRIHGDAGRMDNPRLNHRLRHARDAEGLWYARAELYSDLCKRHNEPHAIHALEALRPLFRGSLPDSLLKTRTPGGMTRHRETA